MRRAKGGVASGVRVGEDHLRKEGSQKKAARLRPSEEKGNWGGEVHIKTQKKGGGGIRRGF